MIDQRDLVDFVREFHRQATGNPPWGKYEADNGPSMFDKASTDPAKDLISIKCHASNVATGNNDGPRAYHRLEGGDPRATPSV